MRWIGSVELQDTIRCVSLVNRASLPKLGIDLGFLLGQPIVLVVILPVLIQDRFDITQLA